MKVYLMSRPNIVWEEWFRFAKDEQVNHTFELGLPESEALVELSGRLCYMSYGKGRKTTKEFIDNLIKSGHHSVLEHANWTVFITGISRSCSHELVRHRHFSFSQLSQRYVDESETEVIMPVALGETGQGDTFDRAVKTAKEAYSSLVKNLELAFAGIQNPTMRRKAARTAARSVLPNAIETKIAVTGNARAWRQFIQTRAVAAADPEIHDLAIRIYRLLCASAPLLFDDILSTRRESGEGELTRIAL